MQKTPETQIWSHPIRVADLVNNVATKFDLTPADDVRAAICDHLGVLDLRKLRMSGQIEPSAKSDWQVTAKLGATVVQACIVTLEPVTTRIDSDIRRVFVRVAPEDAPEMESGAETEMPDDDMIEVLGATIDLGQIMVEALALALPTYPRAPGAQLGDTTVTEPGKTPMTDADARPFSALSSLRNGLSDRSND